MKYRSILPLALLVICIGSYMFYKQSIGSPNKSQFIVGIASGYAPFVSINPRGEYEGFDIDVAGVLAKQLKKKLVLKDLGSMTALFTALDQGTIDAIMWGLSITEDRLKKVAMIHYQGDITASYPMIFWKIIPAGISTIFDMKNKIVCAEPASSQDAVLSKYNFIKSLPVEKVDDALLNIQYGKADAAFVEPAIARKFKNKYQDIKILEVPLAPEDQVQGIGIVVKQDNSKLVKEIQEAINRLKATGVIGKFEQKWDIKL